MFQTRIPTAVKHLLIINIIVFVANFVMQMRGSFDLNSMLGLWSLEVPTSNPYGYFHFWQPLTYMFAHGNFTHIFFNMYALWMFGSVMENFWGTRRFLFYYFACGIGAGLLYLLVPGMHVTIGASGAIYGLLLAFAMNFPKDRVYIFIWMFVLMAASLVFNSINIPALRQIGVFIDEYSILLFLLIFYLGQNGKGLVAIENRWFIAIMTAIELFMGFFIIDGVAHFAHLGGMLIGLLIILWWRKHPFSRF